MNRLATALSELVLVALGVMFIHAGIIRPLRAARPHDDPALAGNRDAEQALSTEHHERFVATAGELHPTLVWLQCVAFGLGGLLCVVIGGIIAVGGLLGKMQVTSATVEHDPEPW